MENEPQISEDTEQDNDPRIEIAIERTQLAYERTQLAWIRSVLALITAGIAIDKGTAALHEARLASGEAWVKDGHFAGMLLSISGTALMILATGINFRRMKELDLMQDFRRKLPSPVFILSVILSLFGALVICFLSKVCSLSLSLSLFFAEPACLQAGG
jgi:putative membrane protein